VTDPHREQRHTRYGAYIPCAIAEEQRTDNAGPMFWALCLHRAVLRRDDESTAQLART
jgi:hypothetical protein